MILFTCIFCVVWHGIIFVRVGPYRHGIFRFVVILEDEWVDLIICVTDMNFIIRLIWTSENRDIIFNKLCTNIHVSLYLYGEEDVYLSQLFRLNGNKTLELQYHSGTFPYGHFSKYGQFFASGKKTIHCTLYLLYLKKCL